jgi:hypothetical protein
VQLCFLGKVNAFSAEKKMGVAELLKLYWSWKHTLASFFNVNVYSSPRQCLSLCVDSISWFSRSLHGCTASALPGQRENTWSTTPCIAPTAAPAFFGSS